MTSPLHRLRFVNRSMNGTLPIDMNTSTASQLSPREVRNAIFVLCKPQPVVNPKLVAFSKPALDLLGLADDFDPDLDSNASGILSGSIPWTGSRPAAHVYAGHQFGYFSGQLGDGAALLMGEILNPKGEYWEVQLKGPGLTPCSRGNDGRKVLRSSIREFLCSEHMHALHIPTTRAGSVVDSSSTVIRDQFYDGRPKRERCAVITRIAPTFLRFGSFEICKLTDPETGRAGPSAGNQDILKTLVNWTLDTYFPTLNRDGTRFILDVATRTANLVAKWDAHGFTHGVLNTDNMSIVGLTLDYGPFGFMEHFDPNFVPNTSDEQGRYAYNKQKAICLWNVHKLLEAVHDVLDTKPTPEQVSKVYVTEYEKEYLSLMSRKLGMEEHESCRTLVEELLHHLHDTATDFTRFFVALRRITVESNVEADLQMVLTCSGALDTLKRIKAPIIPQNQLVMLKQLLDRGDPRFSPEQIQWLRQEIARADEYVANISTWTEQQKYDNDVRVWREWIPKYKSALRMHGLPNRVEIMRVTNPCFVLRNHVAQTAIARAELGDYGEVRRVLGRCMQPYESVDKNPLVLDPPQEDEMPMSAQSGGSCALSCSS